MSSGRFRTWLNLPGLNVSLDLNGRPFYLPRSLAYFYRLVNMTINNNPTGKLRSVPGAEGEVPPPRIVPRQLFNWLYCGVIRTALRKRRTEPGSAPMPNVLSKNEVRAFKENGFVSPVFAISPAEAADCRGRLEAFEAETGRSAVETIHIKGHLFFEWAWWLARHPRLLGAIADL